MTELVQSVRLKYDGAGAVQQINATTAALDGVGDAARKVGPASAGIATLGSDAAGAAGAVAAATGAARDLAQAAQAVAPAGQAIGGIAAEAATATAALGATATSANELAAASAGVAGGAGGIRTIGEMAEASGVDLVQLLARLNQLESELAQTGVGGREAAGGIEALTRQLEEAEARAATLGNRVETLEEQLKRAMKAQRGFAASAGQARAASQDLGYQISDLGTSILGGVSPLRAFTQQSGQVAFALSGMEGAAGTAGRFLAGPWGALILIGVSVLGEFIPKLFESTSQLKEQQDALAKAATAADSYGTAQTLLGKAIDLTTGKLKTHNDVLVQTIKLQAEAGILAAQQNQKDATKALGGAAKPSFVQGVTDSLSGIGNPYGYDDEAGQRLQQSLAARAASLAPLKGTLDAYSASAQAYIAVLNDPKASPAAIAAAGTSFDASLDSTLAKIGDAAKGAGKDIIDTKKLVLDLGTAINDQRANKEALDALNGKGVADDLKPYKAAGTTRPKKTADTSGLVNSVQNDIRSFNAEFTDTPTFVEKARTAIAKLDQDIAALSKKKPPNFQSLIDQANSAKAVIEDNIDKPFDDFIKQQQQSFQVSQLLAAGHVDEANALRTVFQLQQQMGPLTDQQKAGVLATVQALRAEAEQQQANVEHLQKYHEAIADIQSALEGAFTGGLKGIESLPGSIVAAFKRLSAQEIFDKLFGDAFRQLQAQVDGTSTVRDASDRMASALGTTLHPLADLATAASAAADRLSGVTVPSTATVASLGGTADDFIAQHPELFGSSGAGAGSNTADDEIVVTGNKIHDALGLFTSVAQKLLRGVGLSADAAKSIGKTVGSAIQGAAIGSTAAGLFGLTGTSSGSIGSSLGGALGNVGGKALQGTITKGLGDLLGKGLGDALGSAVPVIGSVVGGLLGGVLGSLFHSTKKSSATLDFSTSGTTIGGVTGTSAKRKATATTEGNAVIDSLDQVVDQLGGVLSGLGSVSIGTRNKKFVVDTTGRGKTKGAGTEKFATAEEAEAAALADAIADGAIGGISAAMQKALQSSPDVNKGIAEALKVRDIQDILTGLGTDLLSSFRDFENQAKDRVRIAQQYGFDVTAIEKYNAEQRADLVASTLKQSVGSLQDLLTSLKSGDLAEGDANTKRSALLDQIAAARTDANAGKDGAADTLASLLGNLVQSDRDSFGTAGTQYAADRQLAQTAAEQAIKAESDRIAAAQAAVATTNSSLATANGLADENNAQNAQMLTKLDTVIAALAARGIGGPAVTAASIKAATR